MSRADVEEQAVEAESANDALQSLGGARAYSRNFRSHTSMGASPQAALVRGKRVDSKPTSHRA